MNQGTTSRFAHEMRLIFLSPCENMRRDNKCVFFTHLGYLLDFIFVFHRHIMGGIPPPSRGIVGKTGVLGVKPLLGYKILKRGKKGVSLEKGCASISITNNVCCLSVS